MIPYKLIGLLVFYLIRLIINPEIFKLNISIIDLYSRVFSKIFLIVFLSVGIPAYTTAVSKPEEA